MAKPTVRVATVNVNGVRAAFRKGMGAWLDGRGVDILALQEVRAETSDLEALLGPEWNVLHDAATAKGRAGVAIASRNRASIHRVAIGEEDFDTAGRWLEADFSVGDEVLTVVSAYIHSGEAGTPKQDEKDRFLAEFAPYLAERREKAAAEDREVLVCGDWNIAHTRADIRNWRGNVKNSGFLPHEREWIGAVFDAGYADVVRALHPEVDGPYSWWSYRGRAFDNDTGWRIDYQVATAGLTRRAVAARVERAAEHALRWSDHAPVTVRYQ
jgi:exodeoxyribonuclease-3